MAFLIPWGMVLLLVLLGVLFWRGKSAFLIAGYNTASREEKQQYDEKALCRFMGKLMFTLAGCNAVIILGTVLEYMVLVWGSVILTLGVTFGAVIYANTGNRFRKG